MDLSLNITKQASLNLIKHIFGNGLAHAVQVNLLILAFTTLIIDNKIHQLQFWICILIYIYIVMSIRTIPLWQPDRYINLAMTANDSDKLRALLQDRNWQANMVMIQGHTPLHAACLSCSDEIVTVLLEYGANPNALSNKKETPTHWAVSKSDLTKLGYLIQYRANLDIQDNKGKTPLHWAVHFNSLPTVTFLVEHGADRTICDENGKTPLELSRSKSEWEDVFNYLNSLDSTQI
jgi:ankyrin repeat protein